MVLWPMLMSVLPQSPADLVVLGAQVRTADPARPRAEAIAVTGGRIVFVGDDRGARPFLGPRTRVLEARGLLILPGLIDSHGHVKGLGNSLVQVDLSGTRSLAEVVARAAGGSVERGWILARGWDQNDWDDTARPDHAPLSAAVPDRPALLRLVDGHAVLVNRRALEIAGITSSTPDPAGGRIVRDKRGEATGVLIDNAIDLVTPHLPAETVASARRAIERAQAHLLERGITMAGDAGIGETELEAYRALRAEGALAIRIYAMVEAPGAAFEAALARGPDVDPEARLTVRAVKLFADGALGSRGAALLEPYDDDPGNTGLLLHPPGAMEEICRRAMDAGFQPCVHAIGDRANRLFLDIIERLLAADAPRDLRPRTEHAQILAPEEIPRFARLGVIASMQPIHCTSDMPWAERRVGPRRIRGAYAWRSLLAAGARIAAGSDFPVESADPLLGLHAALTRREPGPPGRAWHEEQRLTFDEALAAYTREGARAAFLEDRLGRLAAGMDADLVILEGVDPDDPSSLLCGRVRATIVAGKIAFSRAENSF